MSFDNPYKILGVKENDSIEYIESAYRNLIKTLHPDKNPVNLGMTKQEQIKQFNMIKYAYKTIKDIKTKITDKKYPDYNMNYHVNTDYVINFNNGLTKDDADNFNSLKFNQAYDHGVVRDNNAGIMNPYSRGYSEFDSGKDYTNTGNISSIPSYTGDISVENSKNVQRPDMKNDNKLITHLPQGCNSLDTCLVYEELGLTNVSNFSMSTSSGLEGYDLMSVYGQNHEPWENTFKRDEKMYSKYTDSEDIFSKANKLQSNRANIYNEPIDKKLIKIEKRQNKIMIDNENLKREYLTKRDEYYDNLNMGRLN
jgi:curved DNA-binding protein CbpA